MYLNKDLKKKFTKTFDLSQIAEDPMDSYLDTLGLWKKRIARDGSCLFRAVAEQIYPCQNYHEKVRLECLKYMSDRKSEFSKFVSTITFDEYLEAMKNPLENGGQIEIAAMSKLYQRDFLIFQHQEQPAVDVTQNGYEKKIYLCFSYNNHFDAIFTKAHRDRLALIQSLVYEILYDRVFDSGEQVSLARKLLRKSDTIYPKEYMGIGQVDSEDLDSIEHEHLDSENELMYANQIEDASETESDASKEEINGENGSTDKTVTAESAESDKTVKVKCKNKEIDINNNESQLISKDKLSLIQKMPLPYKVAKSLDPYIYRNTSFDAWLATKKEIEQTANLNAISILQPGDKCMVKLVNNYSEKWTLAFVQNMLHDSASVFVPELNESHCIPLENLKAYNNANDLLLIHYTGTVTSQYQSYFLNNSNGVQNVQKFVQSINPQFAKIFINTDTKRKNAKKKPFSMKKSSSFHAFSNDLPTLIEVEEQNEDPFLYGAHHYYLNGGGAAHQHSGQHNSLHQHHQHHHPHAHHHQSHNYQHHHLANTQPPPPIMHNSNSYYSLSFSQTNRNSNARGTSNSVASLLTTPSSSTSSSSVSTVPSQAVPPPQPPMNANNMNASNKNRRQKFSNQQHQQSLPTSGYHNSNGKSQQSSGSNNQSSGLVNHGHFVPHAQMAANSLVAPATGMGMPPPPPTAAAAMGSMQPFISSAPSMGAASSTMVQQQGSLFHPAHNQAASTGNQQFLHHQSSSTQSTPSLMSTAATAAPSHLAHAPNTSQQQQQRQNYYNPISSPFMLPPAQGPAASSSHISHVQQQQQPVHQQMAALNAETNQQHNSNFYFNGMAAANNSFKGAAAAQSSFVDQRKRHESLDSYLNTSTSNNSNKTQSNAQTPYQHMPQQPTNTNSSANGPAPASGGGSSSGDSKAVSNSDSSQNTNNYLLMLVPTTNNSQSTTSNASLMQNSQLANSSANNSNSNAATPKPYNMPVSNMNTSLTRSHSYHAGISSYETSNPALNSSSVYVDIYNQPILMNPAGGGGGSANAQHIMGANGVGNNNANPNMVLHQPNAQILNNGSSNSFLLQSSNLVGVDNSVIGYGNGFTGYEMQHYSRFDNSLSNGLVDDSNSSLLLNPSDNRQTNLWNKPNKLTRSTSLFTDMSYGNESGQMANNLNSQQPQQQFCYSNCYVVNIDGPINFNAIHSLQDDGSDLPFSDINTIRFFYNLGIESYRYSQTATYPTTCYTSSSASNPQTGLVNYLNQSNANPTSSNSSAPNVIIGVGATALTTTTTGPSGIACSGGSKQQQSVNNTSITENQLAEPSSNSINNAATAGAPAATTTPSQLVQNHSAKSTQQAAQQKSYNSRRSN